MGGLFSANAFIKEENIEIDTRDRSAKTDEMTNLQLIDHCLKDNHDRAVQLIDHIDPEKLEKLKEAIGVSELRDKNEVEVQLGLIDDD